MSIERQPASRSFSLGPRQALSHLLPTVNSSYKCNHALLILCDVKGSSTLQCVLLIPKTIPLYGQTSIVLIYSSCYEQRVVLTFQLLRVLTPTFYTHDTYKLFLGAHIFFSPEETPRSGLLNCGPDNLHFTFQGIWVVFQSGYTIWQLPHYCQHFVLICDFSCHNRLALLFS